MIIAFVFWVYYIRHWRPPGDLCQRTHMAWDLAKNHELNRDCTSKMCHVDSWWNLLSLHRFSKGTNVFGRVLPIQIVLYIDKCPNPSKTHIYIYIYCNHVLTHHPRFHDMCIHTFKHSLIVSRWNSCPVPVPRSPDPEDIGEISSPEAPTERRHGGWQQFDHWQIGNRLS